MHPSRASVECLESRRLLSFGQPVASYGTDGGGTVIELTSNTNAPYALVVDSAGRTLSVMSTLVIRYAANGKIDTTFASGGTLTMPSGVSLLDAAIDTSGYIYLLADVSGARSSSRAVLYRYTSKGKLDKTWAAGGFANVTTDRGVGDGSQIAFAPNGQIVVAATDGASQVGTSNAFVARFDADGSVDKKFGNKGRVELKLSKTDATYTSRSDGIFDVGVLANNKIVVVGVDQGFTPATRKPDGTYISPEKWGPEHAAIAKLNSNGSFDRTFADGSGYWRRTDITPTSAFVNADGTFAFGGANPDTRPLVTMFEADGSQNWAALGERQTQLSQIMDIAPLADGRIAVAGAERTTYTDPESLTLATASDGVISSAVMPSISTGTPSPFAAHLAAAADGSLFILAPATRNYDGFDPFEQIMMKVDASEPSNGLANVFADIGANEVTAYNDGRADLAYYDRRNRRLMYAHRDAAGFWSDAQEIDGHTRAGEQLAIASTTSGQPWIAYQDGANGDLKITHRQSNGTWTATVVDSHGTTGRYPSIALDSDATPMITYYDASKRNLRFAFMGYGGEWITETIDATAGTGRVSSLDVLRSNWVATPVVAYTDAAGNINYAERKSGTWKTERVVTVSAEATRSGGTPYLDLAALNPGSQPVISFYDSQNGDLKLAYRPTSTTWAARTLASAGVDGLFNRIVIGKPDNTVYVLSYNRSADRLSAFRLKSTDLGGTVKRTIVATGFGASFSIGTFDQRQNPSLAPVVVSGYDAKLGAFRVLDGLLN